jgi:S-adenosylmethionine decarboxylase
MKHLIGRVSGVTIKYIDELEPLMEHVADKCRLTVVGRAFHQFEPFGVTGVLVLSESHFSVHTYPENETIYLDIFCCADHFDPEEAGRVILSAFNGSCAEWQVIDRS